MRIGLLHEYQQYWHLTDFTHQGGLAASSKTGFCGVQECCLKLQGDLLMSACCCCLLWSSFFSLGRAWKWFLRRQKILLQLPSVALLTSPCSVDSLWSSSGFPKIMEWIGSWLSWNSTQAVFLPLQEVTMLTLGGLCCWLGCPAQCHCWQTQRSFTKVNWKHSIYSISVLCSIWFQVSFLVYFLVGFPFSHVNRMEWASPEVS